MTHGRSRVAMAGWPQLVQSRRRRRSVNDVASELLFPLGSSLALAAGERGSFVGVQLSEIQSPDWDTPKATLLTSTYRSQGEPRDPQLPMALRVDDLLAAGVSLHSMLANMRAVDANIEVFADSLRRDAAEPDQVSSSALLVLTSGLEALHGALVGEGPEPVEDYKQGRKATLAAVKATSLSPSEKRFLKENLATRSSYSLESRLRELRRMFDPGSSWPVHSHLLWHIGQPPKPSTEDLLWIKQPEAAIAQARNRVAHGGAPLSRRMLRSAVFHSCQRRRIFDPSATVDF